MEDHPINTLSAREQAIFAHFWTLLALTSGTASWFLVAWLAGTRAYAWPLWVHPLAIAAVSAAYRLSARGMERGRAPAAFGTVGKALLATGFASVITSAVFVVVAAVWAVLEWASHGISSPAQAYVAISAGPLAEWGFRPIGVATILGSLASQLYGFTLGFRRLIVSERTVPIPGLPAPFDGYRILHLSDVHLGPICHRAELRRALATAQAQHADLVCVTGDIVDSPHADLSDWLPELRALAAPDGVLTILGNHDRHVGGNRVAAALRQWTDWRVLRDETACIERDGAQLHVIGVEDGTHDDAVRVANRLVGALPRGAIAVALIHHPGVFDTVAALGVPLTLAGHTHGGQLALPLLPKLNMAWFLGIRRTSGAYADGSSRLFVSRGIGASGQRVRVNAPRELTVLRLTTAQNPS